jgi:hypothetical protein
VARLGRPGLSDARKRQLWDRWKAGESISQIARALDKPPGSVFTVLKSNGGYVPPVRTRRSGSLSIADREEISRGLARGDWLRQIARVLGRPASTVSREVARNKGRDRYRAIDAEDRAWERARRRQPSLLARNPRLRQVVADKLRQDWSPEQIAGYLARTYPERSGMG